jgi:hypothetical protein
MNFGICLLNAIPLRKEPYHSAEMISQILFGETFKVLEATRFWLHVLLDEDNYSGWVCSQQIIFLDELEYDAISKGPSLYIDDLVSYLQKNDSMLPISLGAKLPLLKNQQMRIAKHHFIYDGTVQTGFKPKSGIVATAHFYLQAPHLSGGKTPFGIDASGFTQMVYRINGYSLLREAYQQASQGEVLSFIEESEAGDVAFFDDEEGNIIHTGIILSNNHIIHCFGEVRIDRIDHSGIYNVSTKKHTHNLRVIKQMFREATG